MSKIAIAMSGGVDSSVAAALLREAGHDVVGITLQLWDYSASNLAAGKGRCCSPADIADARRVAAELDFPLYVFDHDQEFRDQIVEPFIDSYLDGHTPSPCIRCNRSIKFGSLRRLARRLGADRLATGHYARLSASAGRPQLRKAIDEDKDQSYFLFDVKAGALANVDFPLGGLSKHAVRVLAERHGLHVADKPESYELCFIPDGDKDAFIENQRGARTLRPGTFRDRGGKSLGDHQGAHRYTIGQRRGLGLTDGQRRYVIDVGSDGDVLLGQESDLYARGLVAERCNWLARPAPEDPIAVAARIRHRHQEAEAILTPLGADRYHVGFEAPQRAITPGQGVAFYDGDLLLGGGWISQQTDPDPGPDPGLSPSLPRAAPG